MPAWPRSTMDSIRVSEAPDTGSIPVEATIFTRGKWFSKTRNVPAGKGRDEIAFFKVIQDLRTDGEDGFCLHERVTEIFVSAEQLPLVYQTPE